MVLLYACSTQKDNAANRRLQNLSARYNYIYNSNVLLTTYLENLSQTYKDNYEQILSIYIAPPSIDYLSDGATTSENKELDDITLKAQTIVSEKNFSNYIDEAYMLLGKANFYKGNYYNAAEYFDYVERAYKKNKNVYLNALNWKARTYMQLQNDKMALRLLDSVAVTLDSVKRGKADPLATLAQMHINKHEYKKAIEFLEKAVKTSGDKQSRTRWPYILGQLYEYDKNYEASLKNYTRVEHSNAPFEMYFNARLSKIRVNDLINQQSSDRKKQLLKLIKDDKNLDYADQIYYEVAEDYYGDRDFKKAEEFYKLSVKESTINQNQKGLSYLKLADLYFKDKSDYVNAKLYYDSALNTLPKNYLNYEQILKKAQNLTYLSDRYQIINTQDTLQSIARLAAPDREKKIALMFEPKLAPVTAEVKNTAKKELSATITNENRNNTFYFSSLTAISRGFTDFKKRWGNRILENNWRQSVKSSSQLTQQNQLNANSGGNVTPANPSDAYTKDQTAIQIQAYTNLLPLTQEQFIQSNQKIIDAYLEIGAFYQQVLEDQQEAIKVYEILLTRFPKNNHLETIYYSLYLGYKAIDKTQSDYYKNLIISNYPSSSYAKTILDPSYSTKQSALDLAINKLYNEVFSLYEKKDFAAVIKSVNDANQRFPGNSLQIQYDYLKAIAIGRTENLDSLLAAFQKITIQFPNDSLITPLIKDHLTYINSNLNIFKNREIALLDFDETAPKFVAQKANPVVISNQPPQPVPVQVPPVITATKPAQTPTIVNQPPTPVPNTIKTDGLFTTAESKTYYFVVNVGTTELSVSSSRFGIGQFNRGTYAGSNLKHQLIDLPEDQVIYIGNFEDVNQVRNYAEEIKPQLPKIMKVPATIYKSFFISKENFDKIKDRATLNRYLEFFKTNYEQQ
ncbi:gliding motility protein [Pedobacter sp. Du54]|uniref:type IX secretion system periplasmic lipoprotein PorW/SprE n=1 Tax=Pedobacter anseongensis TaxID=3133439 RepID=UPI0030B35BEA